MYLYSFVRIFKHNSSMYLSGSKVSDKNCRKEWMKVWYVFSVLEKLISGAHYRIRLLRKQPTENSNLSWWITKYILDCNQTVWKSDLFYAFNMSLFHQLSKFMGQCFSSDTNSSSVSQKINTILGNPNVYYRVHMSSLVSTILIQSPT